MEFDFGQLQDLALLAFEEAAKVELRGGRSFIGGKYATGDSIILPDQSDFMRL